MNYLLVEQLTKSYQEKILFQNISFGINKGQKVALVAKNGAGKSSLLNIIMGRDQPDSGSVRLNKDISTAFLDQNPHLDEDLTIMENVFVGDTSLLKAIRDYEHCLLQQEHEYTPQHAEALQHAQEQMTVLEAWDYELKIKQILTQLDIHDLDQPVKSLSGGQKKRVALSKVLIQEPDFLIMDEPTNHLDITMIEWLEEYLSTKNMTILLVTHDRYFLDRICNQILEIEAGKLYQHKGNFSYFIEQKAHRETVEASELDKVRNTYRRELEWVRKMPKARTTKNKARVDSFYDIEEKAKVKGKEDALQLNVKMTRMGGKILEMVKVAKRFEHIPILKSFSYTFKRHEKIGIVGKNGVGKSTFLNMIMGLEKPDGGKIQTGETIIFGYYSQEGIKLREDKRVIEVIKDIAEFIPLADGSKLSASQLLLKFQFTPDVQYNYVSKLSGGEKRRLYLMTILITNPNFLILDEPTNDLDIITLSILEDFLAEFAGCILIVSHDRYFMDKLVDHIFAFEGEGEVKDYPGNYSDYRNWIDAKEKEEKNKLAQAETGKKEKIQTRQPSTEKKVKQKASFKDKQEFETIEKEIAQLESEKKDLEQILNSNTKPHEDILKASERIADVLTALDKKTMRWLELSEIFDA